ncbi:polysaccharide pyruvyl transferase family protein [Nocardioides sp. BGMRC 2183]|nr:polysaccharide pyruvyl transferase family protein [Nocardioides sp. BGMRC 2183]
MPRTSSCMATDAPLALIHFNHELIDGQVGWRPPGQGGRNPNYGDMLVCASLLRQVRTTGEGDTVRAMFGTELTTPVRAALVRGSTYLSRRFDYAGAIRTIESIDAPIVVVGLGAQDKHEDPSYLDDVPHARDFVRLLAERSVSVSVRGDFTAAVMERMGVTNVRLTGCPSMFYSLRPPAVSLPDRLGGEHQRLGVSLHTGLRKGLFCRNASAALRKHGRVIRWALRSAEHVSLFEQGVALEYTVADPQRTDEERMEAARTILDRLPNGDRLTPRSLVDHMVGVRSVEEWLGDARELDAMIGFRFHGNMVALTQGVPCYYYVYDSRLAEFCRLYRLPYSDVEDQWSDPVAAIRDHDWDATTDAIEGCYRELVAFYEENQIPHALGTVS